MSGQSEYAAAAVGYYYYGDRGVRLGGGNCELDCVVMLQVLHPSNCERDAKARDWRPISM